MAVLPVLLLHFSASSIHLLLFLLFWLEWSNEITKLFKAHELSAKRIFGLNPPGDGYQLILGDFAPFLAQKHAQIYNPYLLVGVDVKLFEHLEIRAVRN